METKPLSHTPTPWKVQRQTQNAQNELTILGPNGNVIGMWRDNTARVDVNAAFIVRAVNAHEELLTIANHFIEYIENHGGKPTQELLQAIAKAEGK